MQQPRLFMMLLGCRLKGRHTEQHDTFFAIGNSMKEIVSQIELFWPDGKNIHVDAWRQVSNVGSFNIKIIPRSSLAVTADHKLFFLNLGGYKKNEFDEFHYKLLVVSKDKSDAIKQSRQTAFYMHTGFTGAPSHVDDKYGIDVDDVYRIEDILSENIKKSFTIVIEKNEDLMVQDELHLGYFPLDSFNE